LSRQSILQSLVCIASHWRFFLAIKLIFNRHVPAKLPAGPASFNAQAAFIGVKENDKNFESCPIRLGFSNADYHPLHYQHRQAHFRFRSTVHCFGAPVWHC
jgi:hypothetical protein